MPSKASLALMRPYSRTRDAFEGISCYHISDRDSMTIFFIILIIVLSYQLLPKGNLLHEGLHLLPWWLKMWRIPSNRQKRTKISYGKHRRQYFLLFEPQNGIITQDKIILYIHGGGWQFGSPDAFAVHGQFLTNQGYAVIMPSHRRLPFFDYHDLREDLDLILKKSFRSPATARLECKKTG